MRTLASTTPARADLSFTRIRGAFAEPIPAPKDGKPAGKTPIDDQLDYQPCTARRVLPWGFSVRVRLRHIGPEWDPVYEQWMDVWQVPARAWHPGDHIEFGVTPPGVWIQFEEIATAIPERAIG